MNKQNHAINNLINSANATDFQETLTEFWECWLTHDNSSNTSAAERAEKLWHYKKLAEFLSSI